jgi:hypothetical protein
MTPEQIDTLAGMIANNLPGLVLERPDREGQSPSKLGNVGRLYANPDEVKVIIRAALNQK